MPRPYKPLPYKRISQWQLIPGPGTYPDYWACQIMVDIPGSSFVVYHGPQVEFCDLCGSKLLRHEVTYFGEYGGMTLYNCVYPSCPNVGRSFIVKES